MSKPVLHPSTAAPPAPFASRMLRLRSWLVPQWVGRRRSVSSKVLPGPETIEPELPPQPRKPALKHSESGWDGSLSSEASSECAVCLENLPLVDMARRVIGECGHAVCNDCFISLERAHAARECEDPLCCPVCRTEIGADPSQWVAFQTDSVRGRQYFQHLETGDTQWTRPKGSRAFWQKVTVQPGNRVCYFNLATGESCSERPSSMRKSIYARQPTAEKAKQLETSAVDGSESEKAAASASATISLAMPPVRRRISMCDEQGDQ